MQKNERPVIADRAPEATNYDTAQRLAHCENVISRGLQTFIEVGEALLTIRNNRLYRHSHDTFDNYCQERWGWTAGRARQLIGAAQTATNVAITGGPAPATESQARELSGLSAAQAATVMRVAHERSNGNVTAAVIRAARLQPWTDAEIRTAVDGYRIHPILAVLPAFTAAEWQPFAESVGRLGIIQRIVLAPDGTTIVDGRFRYLALKWNGINPQTATTEWGEPVLRRLGGWYTEEHIVSHIVSANLIRTHLSDDQKAVIAARLAEVPR